jgi:hypothetical protein
VYSHTVGPSHVRGCAVANPTFGPLLTSTDPKYLTTDNAKAAAGFLAALVALRVAPQALGKVGKYAIGIDAGPAGQLIGSPFAGMNALPQPFGFVPATNYGLAPNFYLPPGIASELPAILPGVSEQRAEEAAAAEAAAKARDDLARRNAPLNTDNFGIDALKALRQIATGPDGPARFADPAATVAAIDIALAEWAASIAEDNARTAARLLAEGKGAGVATNGLNPGGGGQIGNQDTLFGIGNPPPGSQLPGGILGLLTSELPGHTDGTGGGVADTGGTSTGSSGKGTVIGYGKTATDANQGSFLDNFRAIISGDP